VGKSISNPIGAATNLATGGLVGYDPAKGGVTWGVTAGAINKATDGGLSKVAGSIADIALGEKTPGTPDSVIDMASPQGRALQEKALGQYGSMLGQNTDALAANQIAQQEQQARQGVADQEMKARQLVAQRGLGGSAAGINAILGQQQGLGQQLGAIRAQQPGLAQQMKQQNLGFASQGVNQILNEQGQSKVLKMGQQAQGRSGGLLGMALPIAGQIAGSYFGAKAAKAGAASSGGN